MKNLKRVSLELGRKNVIMDDADIDLAIRWSQLGLFFKIGQCCISGSRVFFHERIYEEFVEKSIQATKNCKVGNPLETETEQAPLVDIDRRIWVYINKGKEQGAMHLIGGKKVEGKGYFVNQHFFLTKEMKWPLPKKKYSVLLCQ